VLKLNNIYRIEFAKFMHKIPHGALYTKSLRISFKIFLMFILTIPDSLTTKLILYKESAQILEKNNFL